VVAALSKGDCDLSRLKRESMTVYWAIPDTHIKSHAGFLRALTSATLSAIKADRRGPGRVLLMLDEFGNLGRVEEVENDMTLLRGYKTHICLIAQSIGQLQKNYGEAGFQNIMANSKVQIFFGASDLTTQKYVSDILGNSTIEVESRSVSVSKSKPLNSSSLLGLTHKLATVAASPSTENVMNDFRSSPSGASVSSSFSTSTSFQTRPVLTHDEVGRLPPESIILNIQSTRSIFARRLNYLADPEFQGQFDDNPMHQG
jgi:type IV secretory pathway TraG/TraD family ATPase VirD4